MQNARTITLSPVFTELLPLFNFCSKKLVQSIISGSIEGNKMKLDRRPIEEVQNARTITLSPVLAGCYNHLYKMSVHPSHFCPEHISKSIEDNLMKRNTLIEGYEENCRMQEP